MRPGTFHLVKDKLTKYALPTKDTIGHSKISKNINVFTEFGNLKALTVGYMGKTARLSQDPAITKVDGQYETTIYPPDVIKRCQEIQNEVATRFMDMGIEVVRPGEIDHSRSYTLEGKFVEGGLHTFSPRDNYFYYGDSVYDASPACVTRQYETDAFKWQFEQHRLNGDKWYDSYRHYWTPNAPVFDSANIVRAGLDILYLVSMSGNIEGYYMLRKFMEERYGGKVRVHPMIDTYDGFHIDTTMMTIGYNKLLGKNLVIYNKEHMPVDRIPAIFRGKNWAVARVEPEHMVDVGVLPGFNFTSIWMGQNIFMINPDLVMVEKHQKPFIEFFKQYGIDTFEVAIEHMNSTLGGCHCMTNDYNREEDRDYKKVLESANEDLTRDEKAGLFDPDLLEFLQSKGDMIDWVDICNKEGIFAEHSTLHLNSQQTKELLSYNDKVYSDKFGKH